MLGVSRPNTFTRFIFFLRPANLPILEYEFDNLGSRDHIKITCLERNYGNNFKVLTKNKIIIYNNIEFNIENLENY